ncbi:MAG TPA: hypothetical protein VHA73_13525 [Acidimicrobiales bacterium]|nr:hypothetical protein [Acidimicrobiales bacterium]
MAQPARSGLFRRLWPAGQDDGARAFRLAAIALTGVMAVMLVIVVVAAIMSPESKDQQQQAHQDAIANPQSVSQPDYGQKPQHSSDPGGWEQLALGGLLFGGIGLCGLWVVHTSRKARAARDQRRAPGTAPSA